MSPMRRYDSPADAIEAICARIVSVDSELIDLSRASGRVLAQEVRTDRPSPAVDVSAMDGFAVRVSDLALGRLTIMGEVRIGQEPPDLPARSGACLRMVTGGAIPRGANAVIKREDVEEIGGVIEIASAAALRVIEGEHIRRRGENAEAGMTVLRAGTPITGPATGAMAAVGVVAPRVHRALRVGIIATGDELVSGASTPTPWQLRDSNGPALQSLLGGRAWISEIESHRVADDEPTMDATISTLLSRVDALFMTGGVSAGHRDFVPAALARAGIHTLFHGIPQRPGKPLLGGVSGAGVPVLGLPGNPVSVLVTARRYAVPALERRAGIMSPHHAPLARVRNPDERTLGLWWHRAVRLVGPLEVELIDVRGSGDIVAVASSDGFVEIPPGSAGPGPWPFYPW